MRSSILVTLILASCVAFPALAAPSIEATSPGSPHVIYTANLADANAFYFRLRVNPETYCVAWRWNATGGPNTPEPDLTAIAQGAQSYSVAGTEISDSVNGRNVNRGTTQFIYYFPADGTGHFMVNVSAGGQPILHEYNESGYNETFPTNGGPTWTSGSICDAPEGSGTSGTTEMTVPWLSLISTDHSLTASTVTFDFCEAFNATTNGCTHGDAQGSIEFASESNKSFLKQLKDFDGTFSYNGAPPAGVGSSPSAAGFNLHTTVHVDQGMTGGFVAFPEFGDNYAALSYVGPGGVAGGSPGWSGLSPAMELSTFDGGPGDWLFNAHAYASPNGYASLFLWGADIATS